MSPEILNPEFKVGTLNPQASKSGEVCRVNDFLSNPVVFPPSDSQSGGLSDAVTVVITGMSIDGGRWLPPSCYRSRQSFKMSNTIFLRNRNQTFYRR